MGDSIEQFFRELGQRGHLSTVTKFDGRVRFEVTGGNRTEHWLVSLDRGDITVTQGDADADCTIQADQEVFDRLARGEENAMAATLRGAIVCSGDVELLLAIQRVFPGPAR